MSDFEQLANAVDLRGQDRGRHRLRRRRVRARARPRRGEPIGIEVSEDAVARARERDPDHRYVLGGARAAAAARPVGRRRDADAQPAPRPDPASAFPELARVVRDFVWIAEPLPEGDFFELLRPSTTRPRCARRPGGDLRRDRVRSRPDDRVRRHARGRRRSRRCATACWPPTRLARRASPRSRPTCAASSRPATTSSRCGRTCSRHQPVKISSPLRSSARASMRPSASSAATASASPAAAGRRCACRRGRAARSDRRSTPARASQPREQRRPIPATPRAARIAAGEPARGLDVAAEQPRDRRSSGGRRESARRRGQLGVAALDRTIGVWESITGDWIGYERFSCSSHSRTSAAESPQPCSAPTIASASHVTLPQRRAARDRVHGDPSKKTHPSLIVRGGGRRAYGSQRSEESA